MAQAAQPHEPAELVQAAKAAHQRFALGQRELVERGQRGEGAWGAQLGQAGEPPPDVPRHPKTKAPWAALSKGRLESPQWRI